MPSSLYTPCHFQRTISTDPPWQSTSLSILRVVVKGVLGAATHHVTEYCPLIGPQYLVRLDSSRILSSPDSSLRAEVGWLARLYCNPTMNWFHQNPCDESYILLLASSSDCRSTNITRANFSSSCCNHTKKLHDDWEEVGSISGTH